MSGASVLFIGGSGVISASCVREAVEQGFDVTVLNRGTTGGRPIPEGVTRLQADVSDRSALADAVGDRHWDVVVNWIAFTPDQVQADVEFFAGRTRQYVFISSASAYQTPATHLPITESTPLKNPYWQYSRDKIACEELLMAAYREQDFPVTIVRPSHTYDETKLPLTGGWTAVARMRAGKPIIITGDGSSLWTLTHSRDFAVGFTGLLDNASAIGEPFTITSDEAPTWNAIAHEIAAAAGWTTCGSCTCRLMPSTPWTRSGVRRSSATRRTRRSSTTARSGRSCPGTGRGSRTGRVSARSSPGTRRTRRSRSSTSGSTG